jgi:hypothetical protein
VLLYKEQFDFLSHKKKAECFSGGHNLELSITSILSAIMYIYIIKILDICINIYHGDITYIPIYKMDNVYE